MKELEALKNKIDLNWIGFLVNTREKNYNYERIKSLSELSSSLVYNYVVDSFEVLEKIKPTGKVYYYVAETLKWTEVAKTGSKADRKKWIKNGFDMNVHNIGSSQIYCLENKDYDEVVRVLIKTHGLIGQYIRGEVNLSINKDLYLLIERNLIAKDLLKEVLIVLNECVIRPVSDKLYESIKDEILSSIEKIINNDFEEKIDVMKRFKRLNKRATDEEIQIIDKSYIKDALLKVFNNLELWYYEGALKDFSIIEKTKILLYISANVKEVGHISFEKLMKNIYFDYKEKKIVNIYKKRIIENMLGELSFEDIINSNIKTNPHIRFDITNKNNTFLFNFVFSIQASKLIEFCEVAYTSNSLYNKAVYILYDLFGFRRDKYDRFYNEINYLNVMNASFNNKKILLDYIVGKNVLDVGPGGGILLDLIEESNNTLNVIGIDISKNVIEALNKRKAVEQRKWGIIEGDALYLEKYFNKGSIDTIIYSSIIHELFSYIEYNGEKFNIDTVIKTLKSAYNIIPKGGRIIIRDGIKTEPTDQYRVIEFKNKSDIDILDNYCIDFKGRNISYERVDENKVKMYVNDAMEFLYTYTWGENSYSLEVQEQFGYLTPSEYIDLIEDNLQNSKIIEFKAFLQSGYEENLLNKITIYDENMKIVKLPNSTCIIVIERG